MRDLEVSPMRGLSDRIEVAVRELTKCLQWYLSSLRSDSPKS